MPKVTTKEILDAIITKKRNLIESKKQAIAALEVEVAELNDLVGKLGSKTRA